MRTLIITQGVMGSGKSTWIKENGFADYTLSSDAIRALVSCPYMELNGSYKVGQNTSKKAWEILLDLLEARMRKGELVLVDATHLKLQELEVYNRLAKKYRYRKYFVRFEVTKEVAYERNNMRVYTGNDVPEKAIDRAFNRLTNLKMSSSWKQLDQKDPWKQIMMPEIDGREYESIEVIGDIHGCYSPLKKYFDEFPYSEKRYYIFVGDYLDRGIENRETLEFLLTLADKKNITFLEGNHERWLYAYANDHEEEIKSDEFKNRTIPQIKDIDKSKIREFCRRFAQISLFYMPDKNKVNRKFFVCHGGLPTTPYTEHFPKIPTEQLIKGVGGYEDDIDSLYQKYGRDWLIQIHGHRNISSDNDGNEKSINLEGKVEFGGYLKVARITKDDVVILKYKNDVYRKLASNDFQSSELVREKKLANNISSFNFTKDAFFNQKWDDLTVKARGLFVNTETNEVVARGYEKFFNVDEMPETKIENLKKKLTDKITLYKKENGYLGILSYVNGELMFCSKSTNEGDFAAYFKNLFYKLPLNKDEITSWLKENNYSLVFEVVDIENDPHIIKYDNSNLILLDAIKNQFEFERLPYQELQELAKKFNVDCKTVYKEFKNFDEFKSWYDETVSKDISSLTDIEGVVIECNSFMCKLKFNYYLFWKKMRSCAEALAKHGHCKDVKGKEAQDFLTWLKARPELYAKDIISLREEYEKQKSVS